MEKFVKCGYCNFYAIYTNGNVLSFEVNNIGVVVRTADCVLKTTLRGRLPQVNCTPLFVARSWPEVECAQYVNWRKELVRIVDLLSDKGLQYVGKYRLV